MPQAILSLYKSKNCQLALVHSQAKSTDLLQPLAMNQRQKSAVMAGTLTEGTKPGDSCRK